MRARLQPTRPAETSRGVVPEPSIRQRLAGIGFLLRIVGDPGPARPFPLMRGPFEPIVLFWWRPQASIRAPLSPGGVSMEVASAPAVRPARGKRRASAAFVPRAALFGVLPLLAVAALGAPYYLLSWQERLRSDLHEVLKPSGLVGQSAGLLAFALFVFLWLYPLRKRLSSMAFLGPVPRWLDAHIVAGVLMPLAGAVHAGFRFTGIIGLGYFAMLVVAGSGVIGRYLYLRIPRARSGAELSREEVAARRRGLVGEIVEASGVPAERVRVLLRPPDPGTGRRSVLEHPVGLAPRGPRAAPCRAGADAGAGLGVAGAAPHHRPPGPAGDRALAAGSPPGRHRARVPSLACVPSSVRRDGLPGRNDPRRRGDRVRGHMARLILSPEGLTAIGFVLVTIVLVVRHVRRSASAPPRCPACASEVAPGALRCPRCDVPLQAFEIAGAQTADLEAESETAGKEGRLHAVVRADVCVGCAACIPVCPESGALRMVGKLAVVDVDRCTGHAKCVDACPVGGILMGTGDDVHRVTVPDVGTDFQTNVPGVYLAGELGGRGLIKNAINEGRIAVQAIARSLAGEDRPSASVDALDLAIVGSGPAGLSAALSAKREGLRFAVLEQGTLADSIRKYPRHKLLLAEPVGVPLYGELWVADASKETLLSVWEAMIAEEELDIRYGRRVESVRPGDGMLEVAGDGFVGVGASRAAGQRPTRDAPAARSAGGGPGARLLRRRGDGGVPGASRSRRGRRRQRAGVRDRGGGTGRCRGHAELPRRRVLPREGAQRPQAGGGRGGRSPARVPIQPGAVDPGGPRRPGDVPRRRGTPERRRDRPDRRGASHPLPGEGGGPLRHEADSPGRSERRCSGIGGASWR